MEVNTKELGAIMRAIRGNRSLRVAAAMTGNKISHTHWSYLEKGENPNTGKALQPQPETLKVISDTFGFPYGKLMVAAGHWPEESDESSVALPDNVPTSTTTRLDLKQIEKLLESDIPLDLGDGSEASSEDKDFLLRIVRSMLRDKK